MFRKYSYMCMCYIFVISYSDCDTFNCNCILVSLPWRWPHYWPKHVGEDVIKTKIHHNRTVHAWAVCTLYRAAVFKLPYWNYTGGRGPHVGQPWCATFGNVTSLWTATVSEWVSVHFGTVAVSNGLLRLRNRNFSWRCSIKIETQFVLNGVYNWRAGSVGEALISDVLCNGCERRCNSELLRAVCTPLWPICGGATNNCLP